MKKILAAVFISLFATSVAAEWYHGGSLHKASLSEWNGGTYSNKLATAGDWTAAMLGEDKVRQIGFDGLKVIANEIVKCVDEVAKGSGAGSQSAGEMAAACMILMGG